MLKSKITLKFKCYIKSVTICLFTIVTAIIVWTCKVLYRFCSRFKIPNFICHVYNIYCILPAVKINTLHSSLDHALKKYIFDTKVKIELIEIKTLGEVIECNVQYVTCSSSGKWIAIMLHVVTMCTMQ